MMCFIGEYGLNTKLLTPISEAHSLIYGLLSVARYTYLSRVLHFMMLHLHVLLQNCGTLCHWKYEARIH